MSVLTKRCYAHLNFKLSVIFWEEFRELTCNFNGVLVDPQFSLGEGNRDKLIDILCIQVIETAYLQYLVNGLEDEV